MIYRILLDHYEPHMFMNLSGLEMCYTSIDWVLKPISLFPTFYYNHNDFEYFYTKEGCIIIIPSLL